MTENKNDKAYAKVAQLLATSDLQSSFSKKYSEQILHKKGDINSQISTDTILGFAKPEFFGCTILHIAYKENKLDLFKLLLEHEVDFNVKNQGGSTILHQIIEDTYAKEADTCILEGVSDNPFVTSVLDTIVNRRNSRNLHNEKGITHFHIACMANHTEAAELFLTRQILVNWSVSKDSPIFPGYTAVHFAARFSNVKIILMLFEYGAVHDMKDTKGMTALHILLQQSIEIANRLNKNKVDNANCLISQRIAIEDIVCWILNRNLEQTNVIDNTNLTHLHIACAMESWQIPDNGYGHVKYINEVVNSKSSLFSGNTALHFAALCNVEKVKLLLKKGANINLRNAKKQTAFDLCLERYEVTDIHDIISSQLNWSQTKFSNKTLLDLILCLHHLDLSLLHVKNVVFISKNSPLWPGYNLLHLAVIFSERDCKNNSMIIKKIMQKWKSSSIYIKGDTSPLHLAFYQKKPKTVNLLLNSLCHSAINCMDKLSHLHIACAAGVNSAVEKLLLAGAKINSLVKDSFTWPRHPQSGVNTLSPDVFIPKGSTSLHIAVIVGNCETIKMLIDHGADIYVKDQFGMTPIHWLIVSDNPISPAADIILSASKPIRTSWHVNKHKYSANSFILKEYITEDGLSHLHVACLANNATAVEQLLAAGRSKINGISMCGISNDRKRFPGKLRYSGYTPLHFALETKNEEIVSLLIRHGANVLISNPVKSCIPLYEAFTDKTSPCSDILISLFKNNELLQEQLEGNLGLTMLHFYCCILDDKAAEIFLKNRAADVNNSIIKVSPIWPGFTPLHVLMKFYQNSNRDADTLLNLLLYYEADVTALNADKNTPLHLAYDLDAETSVKIMLLKTLLRSNQKNFNINPRNREGISHFHIACALVDIIAIEKFLEIVAGVDQRVDYFYKDKELSGCAPFHLVLFHPLNKGIEVQIKMQAVDLLNRCGADINADNLLGNTPLHFAVKHCAKNINLLEKIVDCGGNIYFKNILAQTPFEAMLNAKDVTVASVEFFYDHLYPVNAFNSVTQEGFIALAENFSTVEQELVFKFMLEACGNCIDEMGRTIIHNVVSKITECHPCAGSGTLYPVSVSNLGSCTIKIHDNKHIESLGKIVDIDHQDNLGRTALHTATTFKNHLAVSALLQAGADINVVDANNKTAFVYAFENSSFSEGSQENTEKIVRIFSMHVQKLNICMLDVHEMNHNALIEAFKHYNVDVNVSKQFYDELNKMKKVKLESSSITLLNIISGTNNKSISSCVLQLDHRVLNNLFESIDKNRFCESFGIIRLQCRKFSKKSVVC